MQAEKFTLWEFFPDGTYQRVFDAVLVDARKGLTRMKERVASPGAMIGAIAELRLVDTGDFTVAEWKHGEGYTFPPELAAHNGGQP